METKTADRQDVVAVMAGDGFAACGTAYRTAARHALLTGASIVLLQYSNPAFHLRFAYHAVPELSVELQLDQAVHRFALGAEIFDHVGLVWSIVDAGADPVSALTLINHGQVLRLVIVPIPQSKFMGTVFAASVCRRARARVAVPMVTMVGHDTSHLNCRVGRKSAPLLEPAAVVEHELSLAPAGSERLEQPGR